MNKFIPINAGLEFVTSDFYLANSHWCGEITQFPQFIKLREYKPDLALIKEINEYYEESLSRATKIFIDNPDEI